MGGTWRLWRKPVENSALTIYQQYGISDAYYG